MKTDDLALEIVQLKQSHRRMKLLTTTGAILAGCTLLVAAKAPEPFREIRDHQAIQCRSQCERPRSNVEWACRPSRAASRLGLIQA